MRSRPDTSTSTATASRTVALIPTATAGVMPGKRKSKPVSVAKAVAAKNAALNPLA
jgi:hypothetical protein